MEDAADLVLLSICSPEPDFDEHHRQVVGDAEGDLAGPGAAPLIDLSRVKAAAARGAKRHETARFHQSSWRCGGDMAAHCGGTAKN